MVGSAYMRLENAGGLADSLIKITTEVAEASLHQTQIVNTIAQMRPVPELEIPAHSTVDISPGGYHFMLEDLQRDLLDGETIQLILFFSSGKQIVANVIVGIPDDL